MKTEQLNLKLSDEEAARLKQVAEHYSLSPQAVLRMLVKKKSDQLTELAREKRRR